MITNMIEAFGVMFAHDGKDIITSDGKVSRDWDFPKSDWSDFIIAYNKVMVTVGTGHPVMVIEGDPEPSIRQTTAVVSDTGDPLIAKHLCMHRGIVFAGNTVEDAGTPYVNRLRWSAPQEPENFAAFGAGNYQSFENIGSNDEEIMRLVPLGNDMYIFKRDSVWVAVGIATDTISPEYIREVTADHGLLASGAVTVIDDYIIFVSDGGIFKVKDWKIQEVEKDLWTYIEPRPKDFMGKCWLEFDGTNRRLGLIVPTDTENEHELLMRSARGQWSKWLMGTRSPTSLRYMRSAKAMFFGDFWDGVYKLDSTKRADFYYDEFIESKWDTGWIDPSDSYVCLMRSLEIMVRQEGQFKLAVDVYHDMAMYPYQTKVITLSNNEADTDYNAVTDSSRTATYDQYIHHFMDLSGHASKVRFKFRLVRKTNNRFRINNPRFGYIERSGI